MTIFAILAAVLGLNAFAASYDETAPATETGGYESGNSITKVSSPYINPVTMPQPQPSTPFVVPFKQPSSGGVSNSGGDVMPTSNPSPQQQTKPDSSPSAVCARQGRQYDNGKCHEKCTGETSWDGKKCAKKDSQNQSPQPPQAPQGGDGDKGKEQGKADDKDKAAGKDGKAPKDGKGKKGSKCSDSDGICGDTEEEKKKGEELKKYKSGLQPGDPQSQPPTEGGSAPDAGKTASVSSRNPSSALGPAQGGTAKAQQAAGEFLGVEASPQSALTSALGGSFTGIKDAQLKTASIPVQARVDGEVSAMQAALQKAKAAGGEMAQAGVQAGQAVTEAIGKTQAADGASVAAAKAIQAQAMQAKGVGTQFQAGNAGWTACVPMPPADPQGTMCKTPHNTSAGAAKASFMPEQAAMQAEQARASAEQASASVEAAQAKIEAAQAKAAAFKTAVSQASAAVSKVENTAATNTIPGDPNAVQRKSALQSIAQGGRQSVQRLQSIKSATFDPAMQDIRKALDDTSQKLNGQ